MFQNNFSETNVFISCVVFNQQGLSINILSKVDYLASRVEVMDSNILQFDALLRRDRKSLISESGTEIDTRHMDNLEGCMRSAKKLVSAASNIVISLSEASSTAEGSHTGSEVESLFPDRQRRAVLNWLLEPPIHEAENEDDAEAGNPFLANRSQVNPQLRRDNRRGIRL